MHFETTGTLEVLRNMKRKKAYMERGDPRYRDITVAIAAHGGGVCGAICAGEFSALCNEGLLPTIDVIYASSAGAAVSLFVGSGQVLHGRSVFWDVCPKPRFFSHRRMVLWVAGVSLDDRPPRPGMDIDYLCDRVFRGLEENGICLDIDALRSSSIEVNAITTDEDGLANYFDLRRCEDPLLKTKASIAIPGISRGYVRIGNKFHFDGDGAEPFPALRAAKRSGCQNILVLTNRPKPKKDVVETDPLVQFGRLDTLPAGVRDAFKTRQLRYREDYDAFMALPDVYKLITWSDGSISVFERNAHKIEAACLNAEKHMHSLLAKCTELPFVRA
jgi:predicted patatin/cPLA2 family phospholipase